MTTAPQTPEAHPSLIVQKYGGSSLARPDQIHAVAKKIQALHDKGHALLIVVSAMGKTTDQLVELAYQISPSPNRRELDMLLTTGERVSMALMSMALNDLKAPSISLTGSQAGVLTDESHSNARITDIRPTRVEAELGRRHIVVLAGFQGVSPRTKEITTLGRGGSDTTAVAMAAYFRADRCEIRKDVDGVHSADPNATSNTAHLPHLHYSSLLDMTFWGAKVLHYRSVELAAVLKIPLMIALAHGEGRSTLINGEAPMYEQARILSVNAHKDVRWVLIKKTELAPALRAFSESLRASGLPMPQILDSEKRAGACGFLITSPLETLNAIAQLAKTDTAIEMSSVELATVTATCQGSYASIVPEEIAVALERHGVPSHKMLFGAMSVTAVVNSGDREKATQAIHELRL